MTALGAQAVGSVTEQTAVVQTVGLGKSFDNRPILRDVNLVIQSGSFVSLVGPNGAGKSTLLHVLSTLTAPTAGELALFGRSAGHNVAALRARIGVIGHQPMLYRDLSARENLLFFGRLYGVRRPDDRARELLQRVELAERADDFVRTFSRGMLQRVAIARALMHQPELILADEPFTGLDVASIRTLEALLAELHDAGRTIMLANHDIAQSLRLADRVVLLRGGGVALDRPTDQIGADDLEREVAGP